VAHPLTIHLDTLRAAPAYARRDLASLAAALDAAIPAKTFDRNLLVATWNIRRFGSLSERWRARDEHNPKRDWLGAAETASWRYLALVPSDLPSVRFTLVDDTSQTTLVSALLRGTVESCPALTIDLGP
jgi:hypothetical protein